MKSHGAGPLRMVDPKDVVDPIAFPSPIMGMHGSGDWFLPVSTDRRRPPEARVRILSKLLPCTDEWWAMIPEDEKQSAAARQATDYGLDQIGPMTEAVQKARSAYLDGMLEHKYRALVLDRGDGRCKWLRLTEEVRKVHLEREADGLPKCDWALKRCFGHPVPGWAFNTKEASWFQTMWLMAPLQSEQLTPDQMNETIRMWNDHLRGIRPCYHEWVNVSLFFKREVCKHCNAER